MAVVVGRDVGFNVLNGWTVVVGLVGGVVLTQARTRVDVVAGGVVLLLALTPALVGGLGLLYVPSVFFAAVSATRMKEPRRLASSADTADRPVTQ